MPFSLLNFREDTPSAVPLYARWKDDTFGVEARNITWSMNLAGVQFSAGSGIQFSDFEDAVQDAFDAWAAVAGLTFVFQSSFGGADIDIDVALPNDDNFLAGNTVGIAFVSATPSASFTDYDVAVFSEADIFMDEGVTWSPDGENSDLSFFQVVLHEIGHSLGLDHVLDNSEVMHPFANEGALLLGEGDVEGMRLLYGDMRWSDDADFATFLKVGFGQTVYARGGNDTITGTGLADRFYGGAGNDEIDGGGGNDLIVDTRGNNNLSGGAGNDTIIGGTGVLNAQGGAGNDTLIGGIGNDVLNGGSGNDILRGDPSGSFISGNDRLIAGAGDDILEGGGGADTFVFDLSNGDNRITDFERGYDRIEFDGFVLDDGTLTFVGGDTIWTDALGSVDLTITIENVILDASDFI